MTVKYFTLQSSCSKLRRATIVGVTAEFEVMKNDPDLEATSGTSVEYG